MFASFPISIMVHREIVYGGNKGDVFHVKQNFGID